MIASMDFLTACELMKQKNIASESRITDEKQTTIYKHNFLHSSSHAREWVCPRVSKSAEFTSQVLYIFQ